VGETGYEMNHEGPNAEEGPKTEEGAEDEEEQREIRPTFSMWILDERYGSQPSVRKSACKGPRLVMRELEKTEPFGADRDPSIYGFRGMNST